MENPSFSENLGSVDIANSAQKKPEKSAVRMMANHVVGKPPPSHFRAVSSPAGKVPLTGLTGQ